MDTLRILSVGHVCLDIVNELAFYPEEDSDVRATASVHGRGGNAANSVAVLAALAPLGPRPRVCALMAPLADDLAAK